MFSESLLASCRAHHMERQRKNLLIRSSKTQLKNKDHSITSGGTNTRSSPSLYWAKDIPSSWSYTTTASSGGDHRQQQQDYLTGGGFSWPPRSYTCSFCKREFRSAQALGGHMNVHRRDRARLRQSPPPQLDHQRHHYNYPILNLNLNNNPNPNPNFSSSPSPATTVGRHEVSRRSWAPIEGRVLDDQPEAVGRVVIPDHLSRVGTRKSLFGGGGGDDDRYSSSSSSWCDHHGANKHRKRGGDHGFHCNNVNLSLELEIGHVITESTSKNHHHHHEQQLDLELRLGI